MTSNLDRYRKDLDGLTLRGKMLDNAIQRDIYKDEFDNEIKKQLKGKTMTFDQYVKMLPEPKAEYEAWYSEAKVLLKQVLPDRLADFIRLHEKPKGRKEVDYGSYVMEDYLIGLQVTRHGYEVVVDAKTALPLFSQMVNIVQAAKRRFDSTLFDIRQLVQADLLDSEVEAATVLLEHGFGRAAGALCGVVIERHLSQVADNHNVQIRGKLHLSRS